MRNSHLQQTIQIIEPAPHCVFQRDDGDCADIAIQLTVPASVHGVVEARWVTPTESDAWQMLGRVAAGYFSGQYTGVKVGQYKLEIRITADQPDPYLFAVVEPVLVGDLWILAGQSNMEGCGKLVDVEDPQTGISCFYMGDKWGLATEPLCWLNESLDPVNWTVPEHAREEAIRVGRRDRTQGAGLGLPFAKELLRETGIPIGLIMCAHGGTSMEQWDPALRDEGGRSLYGAMMRKVKKLGGKVKGCLWYQGESDANPKDAAVYLERMGAWVSSLRQDVSDQKLPFIYAQLSVFYNWEPDATSWNRIQQEQFAFESVLDRVAMVPTIDASMSDAIHLDAPSLGKVGRRMAWQALRLAYGKEVRQSGPRPSNVVWNDGRTELKVEMVGVNGQLAKVDRITGFHIEDENGNRQIFSAAIGSDGKSVWFHFEQPVAANNWLHHGSGFNPTVSVKDAMGIPLVVFGPLSLE